MALVWILSIGGIGLIASAQEGTAPAVPPSGSNPQTPASGTSSGAQNTGVSADELFYRFEYQDPTKTDPTEKAAASDALTQGTKIGTVNKLPNVTWQKALTEVIKLLLNITGGLTLIAITIGGTMMVVSQGNPDMLEKGKKVTYYSIAGLVIIAVSYAIVIGVSELQFFSGGTAGGDATGQETSAPAASEAPAPGTDSTPSESETD